MDSIDLDRTRPLVAQDHAGGRHGEAVDHRDDVADRRRLPGLEIADADRRQVQPLSQHDAGLDAVPPALGQRHGRRSAVDRDAAELELLKGGAPDFGTIIIEYVPGDVCLELKALKLYLWSFRNDGIFYERAVNRILDDLAAAANPRRLTVTGDFNVRGGIKSVITATHLQATATR